MWYKCEVMGQLNQVHQLKLLQKVTLVKNSDICEDMSKSKNKYTSQVSQKFVQK